MGYRSSGDFPVWVLLYCVKAFTVHWCVAIWSAWPEIPLGPKDTTISGLISDMMAKSLDDTISGSSLFKSWSLYPSMMGGNAPISSMFLLNSASRT